MTSQQTAVARDAADPLAGFRSEFAIPDPELIYLDGNSLGRAPIAARDVVVDALDNGWSDGLVRSWDEWLDLGTRIGDALSPVLGAASGQITLGDQTSVNLFKLAAAGLSGSGRRDIVTDEGNFPSDLYVLDSVARSAGGRLRVLPPDPDASEVAAALDDTVGLVSLSLVAFRSGTLLDQPGINTVVHDAGALTLWDLSHAAGAVPIHLDAAGTDLAIGCTYKYLSGGPGAPAFLYVRREHQERLRQPIAGWYGHRDMFGFEGSYEPAPDINRFLVGTPPILSMIAARAGIELTARAGIDAIRAKSRDLTAWFVQLADAYLAGHGFEVLTPRDPARRGSHVALRHSRAWQVTQALRARRVIVDFRSPDVVRYGFAPLYNTFSQALRAAEITAEICASGAHLEFPEQRRGVT
jgi:kynureninase